MKILSKLKIIITIIAFASVTFSCNEETSELNTSLNDVDLTTLGALKGNPIFSELVKAIELTGLSETLKNNAEPYTFLAPGNEAFNTFLKANSYETINDVPKEVLKQILLYHVLKNQYIVKRYNSTPVEYIEFSTGALETLAPNSNGNLSMNVNTSSGVLLNGTVKILSPDIKTSSGFLHVVDKVIPLPSS